MSLPVRISSGPGKWGGESGKAGDHALQGRRLTSGRASGAGCRAVSAEAATGFSITAAGLRAMQTLPIRRTCQRPAMEDKQARLTILIDPRSKEDFDAICASRDETTSEVVRQLIVGFLARNGVSDQPGQERKRRQRG